MAKRQITLWVEEELLTSFDDLAWGRKLSRSAALVKLMAGAVKADPRPKSR